MQSNWPIERIAKHADVYSGFAFKSADLNDDGGIPVVKIKNVNHGKVDLSDTQFLSQNLVTDKHDKFFLANGDVLIAMTGQGSVGRVGRMRLDSGREALLNQRVGKFVPHETLNLDYFYFIASTDYYETIFFNAGLGSGQPNLSPDDIKNIEIPVPSIEEQKAIAHILGSLDDKIELNRQMNATLEAMAQALFKSWFVDFDPVIDNALAAGNPIPEPLQQRACLRAQHRQAEVRKALTPGPSPQGRGEQESPLPLGEGLGEGLFRKPLPEAIQKQFPNRFVFNDDLGWVPEVWEVNTVGDEIENTGGGTPSTKDPNFWEAGIHPFCTPKDMSSLGSIVLMDTERHLTEAGVNKISSGQLPRGTVLMSSRAPIGYLAVSDIPVSVNQGIIALLPTEKFGSMYLLNWLHFNMPAIRDRANGSTFLEISKKNFRPIPFLVPKLEAAAYFNEQAQSLYEKLHLNSEHIRELTRVRDTLLPKLLSGQLRLPAASLEALAAQAGIPEAERQVACLAGRQAEAI